MPLSQGDWPNFHSAQELLAAFYGGALVTTPHESDYTIGTTATALLSNRGLSRVGALLSNTGSTNIYLSFNPALASPNGVLVLPGGTFSLDWYYDGDLVERTLYAIGSAAGGTLHMLERFLIGA